jgi:hypothetical protein
MDPDVAAALERFLGSDRPAAPKAAVRKLAQAALDAWREGLISTPQVLRTLSQGLEAMHATNR